MHNHIPDLITGATMVITGTATAAYAWWFDRKPQ